MGIYIRGMNMPKDREQYHRVTIYGNGQVIIDHGTYYEEAEAISAPDVRSVVYCKDCIHLGFKDFDGICNGPMCGIVKPWDYCSHGARGGDT